MMFWKKKNKDNVNTSGQSAHEEMTDPVNINVVIRTDLGNVRTNNEDAASFIRVSDEELLRSKGYLLMVADGMGGHNAGEVASKMAVDIIHQEYIKHSNEKNREKLLAAAFNAANKKIFEQASAHDNYRGMGTTCTAIVLVAGTIYFAHAGDSRAYLYKNKKANRITQDHTYVQELVNNGNITSEEAETHPQRNILTNAMGTKPAMRVDTGMYPEPFGVNDRLLICSDGLYDYLSDEEIGAVMESGTLQEAADYFINEAKKRGGKDNITVVMAEHASRITGSNIKETRVADMPVITRDAEIPGDLNSTDHDR